MEKQMSTQESEPKITREYIARGTVTRPVKVEAWVTNKGNPLRQDHEWRASIVIDGRLQWMWFNNKEEAVSWVKGRLPEGMVPDEPGDDLTEKRLKAG
jgi:hypothetical protein